MADAAQPGFIGKYRILDQLGHGGMGVVYRALDPTLDRQVALKVIHNNKFARPEQLARFAAEAKILAQLSSPHIVAVYDYHPGLDQPYLVMELVRGRSLSAVLREEGAMPARKVIDCAWQVLTGLAAAHAAGVLHRDIKPGNILLADNGVYKLADFGLATSSERDGDLTNDGEVVGTVRFLAPERASGGEATALTDCYAFGVTLYELAAGQHPIARDTNPLAIAQRIVREPLPSIKTVVPDFPSDLVAWFDRLLAHDPAQRFPSAAAALQALEAIDLGKLPRQVATTRRIRKKSDDETVPTAVAPQPNTAALDPTLTTSTDRPLVSGTIRPGTSAFSPPSSGLRPAPAHVIQQPRSRFVIKLIIVIWLLSSGATFIAGYAISRHAIAKQNERLRKELINAASAASLMIDGDAHQRLADLQDKAGDDPAFAIMRERLQAFLHTNPDLWFVYTMAKMPNSEKTGIVRFVCDASDEVDRNGNGIVDYDEEVADPGSEYDASDTPQLIAGFTKPSADEKFTEDQWGVLFSGYAPIRAEDGTITGLVGVDMPADHIKAMEADFVQHSMILLAATLVAFLAAGALVAMRMRRPVLALQAGLLKVANGDLDARIELKSNDEFRMLAESFNYMIGELRDVADIRRAFEGFVTNALAAQDHRAVSATSGLRARLHVAFLAKHRGMAVDRQALGTALGQVMPLLFEAMRIHDGYPERVIGTGVLISFSAKHVDDKPQERAVRAALALLSAIEAGGISTRIAIGIDVGEDDHAVEESAALLSQANIKLGTDLLISPRAFHGIRTGFYADHLELEGTGKVIEIEAFAIKGAVSA